MLLNYDIKYNFYLTIKQIGQDGVVVTQWVHSP